MNRYRHRALVSMGTLVMTFGFAQMARAGIPECNDIRLEDVQDCELRGDLECDASCSEFGIYEKACATKLHKVCRKDCVLSADPTCTDDCTVRCSADCDRGVNVICTHNCFLECVGTCEGDCSGADDVEQCQASCEATCDGECDVKCRPIVDGDCYTHCIECCGGSCQADANMECQTTCQDETFEDCEYEFRADCDASCSGDGAIFCDGEYVLSGEQIVPCAKELAKRGIADIDLGGIIDINDGGIDINDDKIAKSSGCSVATPRRATPGAAAAMLLVAALAWVRRRSSRSQS